MEKNLICDKLSKELFKNEGVVLLIGQVIYNFFKGSPKGIIEWKDILDKKYKIYLERVIEEDPEYEYDYPDFIINISEYIKKSYESFTFTFHTSKSIEYLVKIYSKSEKDIPASEEQILAFENAISTQTHRSIALYIQTVSRSIIVSNKSTLFVFDQENSRWREGGTEFITHKFEEIHIMINKEIKKASDTMSETHDENLHFRMENRIKNLDKLRNFISNRSTVSKVYHFLCDFVRDHSIDTKWDSYPNHTGCKNGTIICYNDNVVFRIALPEDYIKKSMSASYGNSTELNKNTLDDWFNKLFPDIELRKYVCKLLASLLIDGNADKSIYFLSGEGNNSKSAFVRAIHICMGVDFYSKKIPSNLLTRPLNSAHQANSALCDLAESRLATFDEPEAQEEFIASNVKSVTGNDGSSARRLNKEARTVDIKTIIMSGMNRVPAFKDPDDACKLRVVIIPFLTRWSDNAPNKIEDQINERHYKIDPDFISNVINLNDEILNLMVEYYPIWYKERLNNKPKAIKDALNEYWEDTDLYDEWAKKSFVKVPNTKVEYNLEDTYQKFYTFFVKNNPKKTPPDLKTYKYHMGQKFGVRYTLRCKRWKDWEFRPEKLSNQD